MVAFSSSALVSAVLVALYASGACSAPTATSNSPAAVAAPAPGATHSVVAGRAGLVFDPENVVAEIGDVVEFHFLPKNHSVVQSSFENPCVPINDNAFFSGFFPTTSGQNVSSSSWFSRLLPALFLSWKASPLTYNSLMSFPSRSPTRSLSGTTVLRLSATTARAAWPA